MRPLLVALLLGFFLPPVPSAAYAEARKPFISVKPMSKMLYQGATLQSTDFSCGAASFTALLYAYFKDYNYRENQLIDEMLLRMSDEENASVTAEGFSMLNLKNLAERLGYVAHGVNLPVEAAEKLKGPIIILLKKKDANHFVVLKGVKGSHAFIADPATGHYRMAMHELQRHWGGESLIIGRDGFGLPTEHSFALPYNNSFAPEQESARMGSRLKPMQINNADVYRLRRF
jgi:predicted double-glycine peptidase